MGIGDWGLGIGDWGLGMGPIPNPQSPIPNPQSPFLFFNIIIIFIFHLNNNKKYIINKARINANFSFDLYYIYLFFVNFKN